MKKRSMEQNLRNNLQIFCSRMPGRAVGSSNNQAATEYLASYMTALGMEVDKQKFFCLDWQDGEVKLSASGNTFQAQASPYTLPGNFAAPLTNVSTLDELKNAELRNTIVLVRGELAKEQLRPKNFTFYNPAEHQRIIALFEKKAPIAIIAATGRNPEMAGSLYPFPLIEDGDFNIPTVYMKDVEGERLAKHLGEEIILKFDSRRIPAQGCNVIASKGQAATRRLVFCAHIDTKPHTPGALDNGTGIVTLMTLAELLVDYQGELLVELVALNGEDHYSAAGQIRYLESNHGNMENIVLAINLDGAGYYKDSLAYSLYGCPDELTRKVKEALADFPGIIAGDPWCQGDHMMFAGQGRPAMAITSNSFGELYTHITHTEMDTVDLVDISKLVELTYALHNLVKNVPSGVNAPLLGPDLPHRLASLP